jgi:hypothetical protein
MVGNVDRIARALRPRPIVMSAPRKSKRFAWVSP